MKLFYLTLSFVIICLSSIAQSSKITGSLSEQNGVPASYVAVVLLNKDSAVVRSVISDETGTFNFHQVKTGKYRLATSSVQYQPYRSSFFDHDETKDYNFGKLSLEASVTQLNEVQVTAARQMVEIHPDKTVFNVQGTINSAGNDGIDLLSKAPGIMLDNNENLIVMGKSGVIVYVDGKRSQLRGDDLIAMLRSLRSENIEAVEIITNPSAKYDAEGNAGIINIRLKRDQNLGWNASIVAGYSIDLLDRHNGGVTINNRGKKYNLFGVYNYFNNSAENHFNFDKTVGDIRIISQNVGIWNNLGHDMRFGGDWYLSKNHTIGVILNGTFNDRDNGSRTQTPFFNTNTGENYQLMIARNDQQFNTKNRQVNFNYQYKGNKGSTLNIDLDYGNYRNDSYSMQPNDYYDGDGNFLYNNTNRNDTDTEIKLQSVKADYETKIGKGMFGSGFKFSAVNTYNIFDFFELINESFEKNLDRSNTFEYDERIGAAYINYNIKLTDKYSLNSGLRYEHTYSLGNLISEQQNADERVKRRYGNFFPNIGMTYEPNKKNKVGVSYTRRIDRPNYQSLNPFEYKLDELNYVKGNPFLRPQYTDVYQITYSLNNKLNIIVNHSISHDFSARIIERVDPAPASVLIPRNLADAKNTAINMSYPFDIVKWWNIRGNVNAFYAQYDGNLNGETISLDVFTYNFSCQNTITLPMNFKAEISAWYNSPSIWSGTIETSRLWATNVGLRKSIHKQQGQINVAVNDVFNSQRIYANSNYGGIVTDGNLRFNWQRLVLGFSYRFGNQKVKGARNRRSGLEDERNRLSEG